MTSMVSSKKPKRCSKGYLSTAWPAFQDHLAEALSRLEEDQFLILTVKCSDRFVQFAGEGAFGMRVETTSNSYLAKPERLNRRQMIALEKLGWRSPTGSPKSATPEKDPDGSPNFFREFPHPVPFEEVAGFAVNTLAEILRVPHPAFLV